MADNPVEIAKDLWQLHLQERERWQKISDYVKQKRGKPQLPDGASDEVKRIAQIAPKNVLTLVRDSFSQNLSVVGYKSSSTGEDLPAWDMWTRNRMDARQSTIYASGLTYGHAYAAAVPTKSGAAFRIRSPKQMLAAYEDPQLDEWPEYALEVWVETEGRKKIRKGYVYTDTMVYPVILGVVVGDEQLSTMNPMIDEKERPFEHKASNCPVVRYINRRDEDDQVLGEVEDLLPMQEQINEANFDRLIVARFGAFPQKVISGWSGSKDEVLAASARRVWAFDDPEVKAQSFPSADLRQYNDLLNEMFEHVAMMAQISPAQVTGQIVNVSAEALAASEANEQRKLMAMRESYGQGHKQLLRLGAEIEGNAANASDADAEIVWRDTEARSFGAVVDGVTKLAAQGVPIEQTLHLVPGMTQRRIGEITEQIQRDRRVSSIMGRIGAAAAEARQDPQVAELSDRSVAVDAA
jgi:hypothetical protein